MRIELALVLLMAGIALAGCSRKDGLNQSGAVTPSVASIPSVSEVKVPEPTALPAKVLIAGMSEAELARQILEAGPLPPATIDEEAEATADESAEGEKLLCAELTR